MNFSESLKEEILVKGAGGACCKRAFLSGFLRGTGALFEENGELGFLSTTDMESATLYVQKLIAERYGVIARSVAAAEDKLNKKTRYGFELTGEDALRVLTDLGIVSVGADGVDVLLKVGRDVIEKDCCKRAFIKGVFLACGFATLPTAQNSTGYHLETVFSHAVPASDFADILASFGIFARVITRRKNYVVYVKSAEEIKDVCALLNCPKAVLKITDVMVLKQMSNDANRQTNCDLGNVSKQVLASERQRADIQIIRETVGFDNVPSDISELCKARLAYPDDTLTELAERLRITKSCIHHRFLKLKKIADGLR